MVVTRAELRIVVQMAYVYIYDAFLIPAQEIELVHIGGSAAVILEKGHMTVEKHLLFFLLFLIILVQRVFAERSLALDAQYFVEIYQSSQKHRFVVFEESNLFGFVTERDGLYISFQSC